MKLSLIGHVLTTATQGNARPDKDEIHGAGVFIGALKEGTLHTSMLQQDVGDGVAAPLTSSARRCSHLDGAWQSSSLLSATDLCKWACGESSLMLSEVGGLTYGYSSVDSLLEDRSSTTSWSMGMKRDRLNWASSSSPSRS